MAVKLRLTRLGAKKRPYYRVVAADSHNKRDGKVIDLIGTYSPLEEVKYNIDEEKALSWIKKGAQPTDTVRSLFSKVGIMEKFHNSSKNK